MLKRLSHHGNNFPSQMKWVIIPWRFSAHWTWFGFQTEFLGWLELQKYSAKFLETIIYKVKPFIKIIGIIRTSALRQDCLLLEVISLVYLQKQTPFPKILDNFLHTCLDFAFLVAYILTSFLLALQILNFLLLRYTLYAIKHILLVYLQIFANTTTT